MYGVSALMPHYAMILIGANMGVQRMTKEHIGIVISLGIPFFIVLTKIDIAPKEKKEKTITDITSRIKAGFQKTILNVKSSSDATFAAQNVADGNLIPIFQISTVTEEGMNDLKTFLSNLSPKFPNFTDFCILKTPKDKTEMLLDHAFNTKFGCIHAGVVVSGKIEVNQKLLLGPTSDGEFKLVQIREIQFLRVSVNELCCGNSCSVRLKSLDKSFELTTNNFRKGMVLLDPETKLEPTLEFEVEALIVHHSTTIKVGYQSVVHCHVIRQTCTIVKMDKEYLRSGDRGIIRFKFMKKPEYMHVGDIILFREGKTRGKGKITKIFPIDLTSLNKDKKTNVNKKQQQNVNNQKNTNSINTNNTNTNTTNKKGKRKYFKNNKNNQNQNNQNQDNNQNKINENKNPPKKKEG
jgi:GTPase